MRYTMPALTHPSAPVSQKDGEPERPQSPRAPGKDDVTPAFDDSGETPTLPARLQPAGRKTGSGSSSRT